MGSCIFGKYNVCTVTDVGHYVYDRSKRSLLNIQRCDLEKTTVEYRRQNIRVCQDHFTIQSFMTPEKTNLTWNAEPTLFHGAIENVMKLIPHQRSLLTCSTSACPLVRMPVREHNDHSYYRARSKDDAKKKKTAESVLVDCVVSVSIQIFISLVPNTYNHTAGGVYMYKHLILEIGFIIISMNCRN